MLGTESGQLEPLRITENSPLTRWQPVVSAGTGSGDEKHLHLGDGGLRQSRRAHSLAPKDQPVICGMRVRKLVYESHPAFIFVNEVQPVGIGMQCAYKASPEADAPIQVDTRWTNLRVESGHILLTIAAVPLSRPDRTYTITMSSPTQGIMRPVQAKRPAAVSRPKH